MKLITRKPYIPALAVGLACFASAAFAAPPPTVVFNLTGVSGGDLAGVYTSPYIGNINGGVSVPVVCDDFADDSYIPESWNAYATNLASLGSSTDTYLRWGADANPSLGLTQTQQYDTAAYLITELLTPGSGLNTNDLSFAIWDLFDNAAFTTIGGTDLANASTYLANAVGAVKTSGAPQSSYSNVEIYSYVPGSGVWNCGGCAPPPQEFIVVSMPEPPSTALLGLYLAGLGCVAFYFRPRGLQSAK